MHNKTIRLLRRYATRQKSQNLSRGQKMPRKMQHFLTTLRGGSNDMSTNSMLGRALPELQGVKTGFLSGRKRLLTRVCTQPHTPPRSIRSYAYAPNYALNWSQARKAVPRITTSSAFRSRDTRHNGESKHVCPTVWMGAGKFGWIAMSHAPVTCKKPKAIDLRHQRSNPSSDKSSGGLRQPGT